MTRSDHAPACSKPDPELTFQVSTIQTTGQAGKKQQHKIKAVSAQQAAEQATQNGCLVVTVRLLNNEIEALAAAILPQPKTPTGIRNKVIDFQARKRALLRKTRALSL